MRPDLIHASTPPHRLASVDWSSLVDGAAALADFVEQGGGNVLLTFPGIKPPWPDPAVPVIPHHANQSIARMIDFMREAVGPDVPRSSGKMGPSIVAGVDASLGSSLAAWLPTGGRTRRAAGREDARLGEDGLPLLTE